MKRGPPPQVVGCVGRQSAAPSWPSFPLQYLPRPASPRPPKPPHIFHLAAPAHKSCFRIKELGTIETGSGPADKWARPVKTVCRSLGARGPSASCHPIPTWWLTQVGPYDHEGIFQGHWATSWSTVGRSKRILSPRPFCLHPTVLCVQNQSPSSSPFVSSSAFPSLPLGFREHLVIPESRPNNFLVMGKPHSNSGFPHLFPLAVPHSWALPLAPAVFCRIPSG